MLAEKTARAPFSRARAPLWPGGGATCGRPPCPFSPPPPLPPRALPPPPPPLLLPLPQGRVRTKTVKRSARVIVEKYYPKLTLDFDTNKRVTDEAAVVPSKRMRNKIAGFVTHLMRRIDRGHDVRGISLKLQEEERERKLDYVPDKSALQPDELTVDKDTFDMLKNLGVDTTQGVLRVDPQRQGGGHRGGDRGERPPRNN